MSLAESILRRDPAAPNEAPPREDDAAARIAIVRAGAILQDMAATAAAS